MRHIQRSPDTIITVAIMPIMFMLLFVYVFGGAIDAGTDNYVNYMLPGILLIAIASGISYTAVRIFTDMQKGIVARFHSMPVARSSVLWGHVLTSLVSNAISLAIIIAGRPAHGLPLQRGPDGWLAVAGILALFTLALTWLAVIPGLTAKSIDGAARVLLPADLPAVHQLRVRPHRHHAGPGPRLRGEPARHRHRRHDPLPAGRGQPVGTDIWTALAWCVGNRRSSPTSSP